VSPLPLVPSIINCPITYFEHPTFSRRCEHLPCHRNSLSLKLASPMDYNYDVASERIKQNIARLLAALPDGVEVVAAAKTRTPEEVLEAVQAGVRIIGENYVNDAKGAHELVGKRAKWHFIGTLRKHNIRKPVLEIFDMIESVDSLEIALEIDKKCAQIGKTMPILIEVNSGREPQKSGVLPEDVERLVGEISGLANIKVMGLMTMGPRFGNPEDFRPYFAETRRIFEEIKGLKLPNVEMKYLSMGMTNSYQVALEEGASMIRIGTGIFGERD
jgi:pyridoxal phosphate enzyme (YggS family)